MTAHSKRTFVCVWCEAPDYDVQTITVPFERLIQKDTDDTYEYIYAMQDELDKILDMKVGDQLSFSFCRDHASLGSITRIK
jgi:hypothetical protein